MQDNLVETGNSQVVQQTDKEQLSPLQKVIAKVDGEGRYQYLSFAIFSMMWFLTAWLLLGMSFFFDNDYTCKDQRFHDDQECRTFVCSKPQSQRPDLIATHASSIVFQFDTYLICADHQNTISLLQAMLFVGAIFGFFIIPYIADNYGRKLGLRIAWGIGVLAVLVTCIADSPNMIGLGLFFIGFGTNPAITLCFSFINQVVLGKSRQRFTVGLQVAFAIGQTTIALIFQTGLTWRAIMYLLLALFVLNYLLVQFFILETPLFFLKKHPEAAIAVLNKMATVNKKDQLTDEQLTDVVQRQDNDELHPQQKSLGFFDLFRYKSIRWTSISAAMILFGIQAMYYSSQLNEASVGFTKTINQIVFGISQIFGYLSAELLVHKITRKKSTFIGMGVSSLLCLALAGMVALQNQDNKQIFKWIQTVGLMANRFVLCSFWSIFFIYIAELYPTEIRSLGFGWTSVVGMLGSSISPFIGSIAETIGLNSWFPPAIIGFIACFFTFCLPETFKLPLKDIIEERMETLKRQKDHLDQDDPDDDDEDEIDRSSSFGKIHQRNQAKKGVNFSNTVDQNSDLKTQG